MVIQFLAWSESVVYGQDVLTRFRTAIQIEIENLLHSSILSSIDDPAIHRSLARILRHRLELVDFVFHDFCVETRDSTPDF